jgi:hypothetical protein
LDKAFELVENRQKNIDQMMKQIHVINGKQVYVPLQMGTNQTMLQQPYANPMYQDFNNNPGLRSNSLPHLHHPYPL